MNTLIISVVGVVIILVILYYFLYRKKSSSLYRATLTTTSKPEYIIGTRVGSATGAIVMNDIPSTGGYTLAWEWHCRSKDNGKPLPLPNNSRWMLWTSTFSYKWDDEMANKWPGRLILFEVLLTENPSPDMLIVSGFSYESWHRRDGVSQGFINCGNVSTNIDTKLPTIDRKLYPVSIPWSVLSPSRKANDLAYFYDVGNVYLGHYNNSDAFWELRLSSISLIPFSYLLSSSASVIIGGARGWVCRGSPVSAVTSRVGYNFGIARDFTNPITSLGANNGEFNASIFSIDSTSVLASGGCGENQTHCVLLTWLGNPVAINSPDFIEKCRVGSTDPDVKRVCKAYGLDNIASATNQLKELCKKDIINPVCSQYYKSARESGSDLTWASDVTNYCSTTGVDYCSMPNEKALLDERVVEDATRVKVLADYYTTLNPTESNVFYFSTSISGLKDLCCENKECKFIARATIKSNIDTPVYWAVDDSASFYVNNVEVKSDNNSHGVGTTIPIKEGDVLKWVCHNASNSAGFRASIYYDGKIYNTGDNSLDNGGGFKLESGILPDVVAPASGAPWVGWITNAGISEKLAKANWIWNLLTANTSAPVGDVAFVWKAPSKTTLTENQYVYTIEKLWNTEPNCTTYIPDKGDTSIPIEWLSYSRSTDIVWNANFFGFAGVSPLKWSAPIYLTKDKLYPTPMEAYFETINDVETKIKSKLALNTDYQKLKEVAEKADCMLAKKQMCGCFLPQSVYDVYFEQLKARLKGTASESLPEYKTCYFPDCARSELKPTTLETCPSITNCIQNVVVDAKGNINNLDINSSAECGNFLGKWSVGDWGTCENGVQTRDVKCSSSSCSGDKPSITQSCAGEWMVSNWGECSAKCGGGQRKRTAICPEGKVCDASNKPAEIEPCNEDVACGNWKVGEWTTCNAKCGETGKQTRDVMCPSGIICEEANKPNTEQECSGEPCEGESSNTTLYIVIGVVAVVAIVGGVVLKMKK